MNKSALNPHRLDSLIASVAAGSKDALGELYRAVSPSVYSYALSITKNGFDAEDVLHDCFLTVSTHASEYKSDGKPMAWILTIARNLCFQQIRREKQCQEVQSIDLQPVIHTGPEATVEDKMVIAACLEHLTPDQRQIVVLHIVAQLKFREIAGFLHTPLSTVLSTYYRALKRMKEFL